MPIEKADNSEGLTAKHQLGWNTVITKLTVNVVYFSTYAVTIDGNMAKFWSFVLNGRF